ncbi:hypothetical protein ES703_77285 [subsurface metagenome]
MALFNLGSKTQNVFLLTGRPINYDQCRVFKENESLLEPVKTGRTHYKIWHQRFYVLTIAKTGKTKKNLRKITRGADERKRGSLMFWFTSEENYNIQEPESILGPIWQTPKDDTYHSLLEWRNKNR